MGDNRGTWIGFLLTCFVVVGLAGIFASFAAPLPYQRAFSQLAALEAAPTNAAAPGSAPAAAPLTPARIRAEAEREAEAVTVRLRFLLVVLTLLAGGFGTAVMLLYRRQVVPPRPTP